VVQPGLRDRVVGSDNPRLWSGVAAVAGALRWFDRSGRWAARRGFALRRAGRTEESVAAYAQAVEAGPTAVHLAGLGGALEHEQRWFEAAEAFRAARASQGRDGWLDEEARCRREANDWEGLAVLSRQAVERRPEQARWWSELGVALTELGELTAARDAHSQAVACGEPTHRHYLALARCERRRGDAAAADAAFRGAAELGGARAKVTRREWAELLADAGRFGPAEELLRSNVAAFPDDARSLKELGILLLERHMWGGTFVDPLGVTGAFDTDDVGGAAGRTRLKAAGAALEEAVRLHPHRAGWGYRLGEVHELLGDLDAAIVRFQAAVDATASGQGGWVFRAKHPWQFRLERAHHLAGRPRVSDPLFDVTLVPEGGPVAAPGEVGPPGMFRLRTNHTGFVIEGFLLTGECPHVDLELDGTFLRSLNVSRDATSPRFSLNVQRETVDRFPRSASVRVRTPDGRCLAGPGGAERVAVAVPHGDGSLPQIISTGGKLDKKGDISPSPEQTRVNQQRYLELYAEVRDVLEARLGRRLFLMYGTLLGCIREGDFIPGDDDFDAGYVSDETDPEMVKKETEDIILELLRAGFTVSFNRRGRLFRAQRERTGGEGIHLDLRPVWFADGRVWVHNHASFPSNREDFLPVVEGDLRGTKVYLPRRSERFLERHYGPGWRVPDPGFTYYADEVDPTVRETLARALISPEEYRDLAARVEREERTQPQMGRLVSIGSQELYPLEDFVH
jgi:tetratricopeptide (TPR) repeat protein